MIWSLILKIFMIRGFVYFINSIKSLPYEISISLVLKCNYKEAL